MAVPTGSPSPVRAYRRWRICLDWASPRSARRLARVFAQALARQRVRAVAAEAAASRCAPLDRHGAGAGGFARGVWGGPPGAVRPGGQALARLPPRPRRQQAPPKEPRPRAQAYAVRTAARRAVPAVIPGVPAHRDWPDCAAEAPFV